ncbi:MAG: hypothetical protein QNI93_04105 [Kiloniellales bacterium]|nr:hypothetical protein [Kiloniellales bacterium]
MRGTIIGLVMAVLALPASALAATQGERVKIKGEIIDTWCYFSGVMGGPDSVVGSAHHTCALWCAAGGIPVGVLAEDGTVYMVLKYEGDDHVTGGDTILEVQSNLISADGLLYQRDGINYLVVEKVTANEGIVNLSHEDYDVIPPFAIPKPKK